MPEMKTRPPLDELRRIYAETKTIAVVGASPDTTKRAQVVPAYLQDQGYRIIPVNPGRDLIFGDAPRDVAFDERFDLLGGQLSAVTLDADEIDGPHTNGPFQLRPV